MEAVPVETEYKLAEYLHRQLTILETEISLLKSRNKPQSENFNYTLGMSVVDADPSPGLFRIDNLNWALATNLYFDDLSVSGVDVITKVRAMKRNDEIVLQDAVTAANRIRYRVGALTLAAGYFKFSILSVVAITGVKPVVNTLFNTRFVMY